MLSSMNEDQRTRLEEEVIAPTARGLRRFGIGAAQAASAALALFGLAGGSIGALLRFSATNQFVLTLGTIGLAVGATALTFGAAGFFGFRKVKTLTDEREVHRRLLALTLREGSATDAEAARRLKTPLADVREAAETLVREGKLTLDIDPRTGTETYVADEDDLRRRLPAEERIALAAFDTELASATAEAQEASSTAEDEDEEAEAPEVARAHQAR